MKNLLSKFAPKKAPTGTMPRELDLNLGRQTPVNRVMDFMRSKVVRKLGAALSLFAVSTAAGCNWGSSDSSTSSSNNNDVPNPDQGGTTLTKGAVQQELSVNLHPDGLSLDSITYQPNDTDTDEPVTKSAEVSNDDDIHPGYNGPLVVQNGACVGNLVLEQSDEGQETISGELILEMQDGSIHYVAVSANCADGVARFPVQDSIDQYNLDNPYDTIDVSQIATLTTSFDDTLEVVLSSAASVAYDQETGNVKLGEKSAAFNESAITQTCTFTNGITVNMTLTQLDNDDDGVGNLGDSLPDGVAVLSSVVDGQDATMRTTIGTRNGEELLPAELEGKFVWYDEDGNAIGEDVIPYSLQPDATYDINFQGPQTGFISCEFIISDPSTHAVVGLEEFNIWVDGDDDSDGTGNLVDYVNDGLTVPNNSVGLGEDFDLTYTINTPAGSAAASYVIITDQLTGETWPQMPVQEGKNTFTISVDDPGEHTLIVNAYDVNGNFIQGSTVQNKINAFNDLDSDDTPDHLDYNIGTKFQVPNEVTQGKAFTLAGLTLQTPAGYPAITGGVLTVLKDGVPTTEVYDITGFVEGANTLDDLILNTIGKNMSLQLELYAGAILVDTSVTNTFEVKEADNDGDGAVNSEDPVAEGLSYTETAGVYEAIPLTGELTLPDGYDGCNVYLNIPDTGVGTDAVAVLKPAGGYTLAFRHDFGQFSDGDQLDKQLVFPAVGIKNLTLTFEKAGLPTLTEKFTITIQ